MGAFELIAAGSVDIRPADPAEGLVTAFCGLIRYRTETGPGDDLAGRLRAYRVHLGLAAEAGGGGPEACRAHGGRATRFADTVFGITPGSYAAQVTSLFGGVDGDCLILDHVVLRPKWRRLGVGRNVLRRAIATLGSGCGLVVCVAAPLVADEAAAVRVPADWLSPGSDTGEYWGRRVELVRLVRSLGFQRLPGTQVHALVPKTRTTTPAAHRAQEEWP